MNKKNILIVDDNPEIIQIITNILSSNPNYNLYQTTEVDFAVSIANQRDLDLVISDWDMPIKSGLDLITNFKSIEKTKDIPIIIVTGKLINSEDLEIAFETGAIDYMRKPLDELELNARVSSILKINEYQKNIIESKNKELTLHAMYLVQGKEKQQYYFKKLKNIVKKLEDSKQSALNYIQEFVNETYGDLQRDGSENFELYFNQLNPDFTKRLSGQFPTLTPSEIRLCIFLRANMDTKTIADIIHMTVDSVKTSRSRLRNKFNLERKINLTNFICSI